MKKKLLALLLCLTLCLPLVLASCTIPTFTQNQPKSPSFIDDILCVWENKDSYDSASSFVPNGVVANQNSNFVYTVSVDYADQSIGLFVEKTHYRVYNVARAAGELIFEDSTLFDVNTLDYTSESKAITVTLLDKMIFVTKTSTQTQKETAYIYDENGKELLKAENTALTVVDENRIILSDKLYVLKDGVLEMKKDLSEISYDFYSMITNLVPYGDRYLYLDGTTAYVFDENYNFLYKKALKQTLGATFAEEKYSYFILENGNIIFQITYSIGAYSPSIQSYTYDYILNGKCYKLDSYLLDIRTEKYTEFEISYVLNSVIPVETNGEGASLPYGAQNIGVGQKIDGKKLVTANGATYSSFLLYNSGKTSGMPSVDGSANITVVNEERFFVESDFSVKIYDKNATLIETIGSYEYYNEKFIVTGSEILNYNLEVVYSLKDNSAAVYDVTADSVIIIKYDKESNSSKSYLITDKSEPKEIIGDVSLFSCQSFFATLSENDGTQKILIYKTNGDLINEFIIHEDSGLENIYEHDTFVVFETKNIEGKTMFITIFKTVKI